MELLDLPNEMLVQVLVWCSSHCKFALINALLTCKHLLSLKEDVYCEAKSRWFENYCRWTDIYPSFMNKENSTRTRARSVYDPQFYEPSFRLDIFKGQKSVTAEKSITGRETAKSIPRLKEHQLYYHMKDERYPLFIIYEWYEDSDIDEILEWEPSFILVQMMCLVGYHRPPSHSFKLAFKDEYVSCICSTAKQIKIKYKKHIPGHVGTDKQLAYLYRDFLTQYGLFGNVRDDQWNPIH